MSLSFPRFTCPVVVILIVTLRAKTTSRAKRVQVRNDNRSNRRRHEPANRIRKCYLGTSAVRLLLRSVSLHFTDVSGSHSTLDFSYAFGFDRFNTNQRLESNSNATSMNFSALLGRRWKLNVSESFQVTRISGHSMPFAASYRFPKDFGMYSNLWCFADQHKRTPEVSLSNTRLAKDRPYP